MSRSGLACRSAADRVIVFPSPVVLAALTEVELAPAAGAPADCGRAGPAGPADDGRKGRSPPPPLPPPPPLAALAADGATVEAPVWEPLAPPSCEATPADAGVRGDADPGRMLNVLPRCAVGRAAPPARQPAAVVPPAPVSGAVRCVGCWRCVICGGCGGCGCGGCGCGPFDAGCCDCCAATSAAVAAAALNGAVDAVVKTPRAADAPPRRLLSASRLSRARVRASNLLSMWAAAEAWLLRAGAWPAQPSCSRARRCLESCMVPPMLPTNCNNNNTNYPDTQSWPTAQQHHQHHQQ